MEARNETAKGKDNDDGEIEATILTVSSKMENHACTHKTFFSHCALTSSYNTPDKVFICPA